MRTRKVRNLKKDSSPIEVIGSYDMIQNGL